MWVRATSPLPPPSPWPSSIHLCSITTSTKPPQKLFSLAVSAQCRQQRPLTQHNHPKASLMAQPLLTTAFKSNAERQPSSSGSTHNSPGQQRPLSGSNVLWALKRATAEKSKKKKKDVSCISRAPKAGNGQDKVAANFRPLSIKTEWSVRLEQLEMRLQQLMDA